MEAGLELFKKPPGGLLPRGEMCAQERKDGGGVGLRRRRGVWGRWAAPLADGADTGVPRALRPLPLLSGRPGHCGGGGSAGASSRSGKACWGPERSRVCTTWQWGPPKALGAVQGGRTPRSWVCSTGWRVRRGATTGCRERTHHPSTSGGRGYENEMSSRPRKILTRQNVNNLVMWPPTHRPAKLTHYAWNTRTGVG